MFEESTLWLQSLKIWQLILLPIGLILAFEVGQGIFAGIYNVFFHPLRHLPGDQWDIFAPVLVYIRIIRGKAGHAAYERHLRYGNVVRTGANIVSFIEPAAWKEIYGATADLPKYLIPGAFPEDSIQVMGKRDHPRVRKIMAPSFSDKNLVQQEQLIRGYVDLLIQRLQETKGEPTNAVWWYNLATFDLIGDLTFGQSLGGLEKMKINQWLDAMNKQMFFIPFLIIMRVSKIVGLLITITLGPRIMAAKAKARAAVKVMVAQRAKQGDRGDFMDSMIGRLPEHELIGNADILMIAGSHTSSVLLSGLTYFLCKNPRVYDKLKKEVRDAFGDANQITFKTCEKLPYLQAVIEESLRLFPPVPVSLSRKTIAPTKICGYDFPANIQVGIPHLAAYMHPSNFHRPTEFIPERWIERANPDSPFHSDKIDVFEPFSYGPRNCIGKTLAYHELRFITAKIIYGFDIELEPQCKRWVEEQRIFATWELPPLMVRYLEKGGKGEK